MTGPAARMARAAGGGGGMTFVAGHEPSLWLRARLADVATRWAAGDIDTCRHLRLGMVGVAAMWAPRRVVCGSCSPQLRLTGDADRTCDRCGHVGVPIHAEIVNLGPALVLFGLCPPCHRREVPA